MGAHRPWAEGLGPGELAVEGGGWPQEGPMGGFCSTCLTALLPVRPGSPWSEGLTVLSGRAWGSPSASSCPRPPCAEASTHLFLGWGTPEPHTLRLHYHGPHPRPHICPHPRPLDKPPWGILEAAPL